MIWGIITLFIQILRNIEIGTIGSDFGEASFIVIPTFETLFIAYSLPSLIIFKCARSNLGKKLQPNFAGFANPPFNQDMYPRQEQVPASQTNQYARPKIS